MSEFDPQPLSARQLVALHHLRVWRHFGHDGVNVYDEQLASKLREAGCHVRPWQPEPVSNPSRQAWDCVLPEEEPDGLGEGT